MDDFTQSKERVRHAVFARIGAAQRRRKKRRLTAVLVGAPLLAASATGGFAILNLTDTQRSYTAICYEGSTPDSPHTEVGMAAGGTIVGHHQDGSPIVKDTPDPEVVSPEERCAPLWRDGILGGETGQQEVPPLVACLQDDWMYAVFRAPGDAPADPATFCPDIGMRPATIDTSTF